MTLLLHSLIDNIIWQIARYEKYVVVFWNQKDMVEVKLRQNWLCLCFARLD